MIDLSVFTQKTEKRLDIPKAFFGKKAFVTLKVIERQTYEYIKKIQPKSYVMKLYLAYDDLPQEIKDGADNKKYIKAAGELSEMEIRTGLAIDEQIFETCITLGIDKTKHDFVVDGQPVELDNKIWNAIGRVKRPYDTGTQTLIEYLCNEVLIFQESFSVPLKNTSSSSGQ